MQKLVTCLLFVGEQYGKAEEAVNLYISLFSHSRILLMDRYGPNDGQVEGTVRRARFTLDGVEFLAMDQAGAHDFTFTPASSIFVRCHNVGEMERIYDGLQERGRVLMAPDNYGFSYRFAWVNDRYGVSWQLNVDHAI